MSRKIKKRKGAPYVETDITQLGDKALSPQEVIIREREDLLKQASKCKIYGQDELSDPDRSSGPRLHWAEVVRRILSLNPKIKIMDGAPGCIAIYRPKRFDEYDEQERDRGKDDFFWHHRYVTGVVKDILPEYSHLELDSSQLPTREIRSWRSLLMPLVKSRAITYRQAIQAFGDPTGDRRSNRWFDDLKNYMS